MQTVSPRAIEEEAELGFKIALIGTPEHRAVLREELLTSAATVAEREDADAYLREYDEGPDADTASGFSFLIYTAGPDEPLGVRGPDSIPLVGKLNDIMSDMLALKPKLLVALPRRLPAFRSPASDLLIRSASRANATIALISALPGILPWTAPLLPASSIADVLLLTKNQLVLVMRLAAAFGQKPGYMKQAKELLGTVGGALGWRTLARELAGFVPAGFGVALKATIAYSGTVAVGRSAQWFYQTGKKPTEEQIKEFNREAEAEAKSEVDAIREEVVRPKEPGTPNTTAEDATPNTDPLHE